MRNYKQPCFKCGGKVHYDKGGSFSPHYMYDPNDPNVSVFAESMEDHNYYKDLGYIHKDQLPMANMGMAVTFEDMQKQLARKAKEKHNKKYFKGPSSPQNVNTDEYGNAINNMFTGYLKDNVDDVTNDRALDMLRKAYAEGYGMPAPFNLGGNFFSNYNPYGTFGLNPRSDYAMNAFGDAYQMGQPGADFLKTGLNFGIDLGSTMYKSLKSPVYKQRQFYQESSDDLLGGRQFDPKAYKIFGKDRARVPGEDGGSEYLYGVKDIFDKERLEEKRSAKASQKKKAGKQDLRQDVRDARKEKNLYKRGEEEWHDAKADLQAAKEKQANTINWRKWSDLKPYGAESPIDQPIEDATIIEETPVGTPSYGSNFKLQNPWAMRRDKFGRLLDENGNLVNPFGRLNKWNQFGGKVDPRKRMYHMGGNLPPHNHSSSAQDMSDMVTPDGRRIKLQGFDSGTPNDPLNIDALKSANRPGVWQVETGSEMGGYTTYVPSEFEGSDFDHWQNFGPRWGGADPVLGSTWDDERPKIPGVTGYWSTAPGVMHEGHPGVFNYEAYFPDLFQTYRQHRGDWFPGAAPNVAEIAEEAVKGGGDGKGNGKKKPAKGTPDSQADPGKDYDQWMQEQKNVSGGARGNVTDSDIDIQNTIGYGAGFPGYIEVAPGVKALSWGPNTQVASFHSDKRYRMFGRGPKRNRTDIFFSTSLPGKQNAQEASDSPEANVTDDGMTYHPGMDRFVNAQGIAPYPGVHMFDPGSPLASPAPEGTGIMMDNAGNEIVISPDHPAWNKPAPNWQDYQFDSRWISPYRTSVAATSNQDAATDVASGTRRGKKKLERAEKKVGGPIYMDGGMHHPMYMGGGGYPPMYQPVELSEEEIANILAAGGSIKYL